MAFSASKVLLTMLTEAFPVLVGSLASPIAVPPFMTMEVPLNATSHWSLVTTALAEKLNFVKSKFPEIYEQINFFTDFEKEKYLEYYQINKYPHSNILIFSKENGKIYHFVENYQD